MLPQYPHAILEATVNMAMVANKAAGVEAIGSAGDKLADDSEAFPMGV